MDKLEIINQAFAWFRYNGYVNSQKDFATLIRVDRSTICRAMKGDEKYLTDSLVTKVVNTRKEYESGCSEPTPVPASIESHIPIHSEVLVPTVPYKVYREMNLDLQVYMENPDTPLHCSPAIAQFAQTDCHYFVNDNAMLPQLHPNDVLALKRIPDEARVINGEICVINCKYNGLLARYVYDDGDGIILKASDSQTRFTDMRLSKDEIFGIYRILGLVRTNI